MPRFRCGRSHNSQVWTDPTGWWWVRRGVSATRGRNPGFRLTQRAYAPGGTSQPTGWGSVATGRTLGRRHHTRVARPLLTVHQPVGTEGTFPGLDRRSDPRSAAPRQPPVQPPRARRSAPARTRRPPPRILIRAGRWPVPAADLVAAREDRRTPGPVRRILPDRPWSRGGLSA